MTAHLGGLFTYYDVREKTRRVLLIDYDPQFNLSQAFIPPERYFQLEKRRKTSLSILQDDETKIDPYKIQVPGNLDPPSVMRLRYVVAEFRDGSRLDLVPSTLELMYIALGQTDRRTNAFEERFSKFVRECRRKYDIILIDCHPAGSILTKTSLQNSDHVLIPVAPDPYAVRGVGLMLQFIAANRHGRKQAKPHILFNNAPRTGSFPVEKEIRGNKKFSGFCLKSTMKHYKAFAEPMGGKDFVWSSQKPWSTRALANVLDVADELADRIDTDQKP